LGEPVFFERPEDLRAWFAENATTATELIVGYHRVGTGRACITWQQSVDEALCVGWIDSVRYSLDPERAAQRFTPRRKGSVWSAINVAKIEKLRAEGRMRPAGEAAFAERRADRTGVYSFERTEEPRLSPDEESRFRGNPAAWAWFTARPPSFRKQALHWVVSPKRPETRERRLSTLIDDAARGLPPKPLRYGS
jgi:uncharacterized protein YdeI (YjbR/CyaY-like superfamily)